MRLDDFNAVAVSAAAMLVPTFLFTVILGLILNSSEKRSSMSGKITACQCITVMIGCLFTGITAAMFTTFPFRKSVQDGYLHALIGFFYFNSQLWLCVFCFEVYYNFRSLKSMIKYDSSNHRVATYVVLTIVLSIALTSGVEILLNIGKVEPNSIGVLACYGVPAALIAIFSLTFSTVAIFSVLTLVRQQDSQSSTPKKLTPINMLIWMLIIHTFFEAALVYTVMISMWEPLILSTVLVRRVFSSMVYLILTNKK
ncbi:Hypothetical predicted protein [Cloeon dipterum]|uniref:Uncharacterized protein n=1 Tax=Cloeon dipterum TaxID=197152 RepID=A0A8S1CXM4_9INSE|nr:Hypothetical predicted protein [Cloeon dipterum]